ncbi:hypothetical protein CHS0354_025609 [Potamilus streckersoni]|uniref:Uncharacterized protein n=1 Tax=Potamilus streckersoni TaxID=2493646 RepID=A0AAE0S175_9BIVA|nr:hypothetical protein CHS0354_025609 [Potamilus streckersoni]
MRIEGSDVDEPYDCSLKMTESKQCYLFLLLTFVTQIPSGDTYIVSKNVCLGDSVLLFQNVSLTNNTRTLVISQAYGDAIKKIAKWSINDSVIHPSVDKRFEKILSFDNYGNIWMRNVQQFKEGRYTLLAADDSGAVNILVVDLIVLVAPSLHCKPIIDDDGKHLIAFLNASACGIPAASSYWLGYNNQNVIAVQPEKESGPYHACIKGPSLRCVRRFKAADYCTPRGGPARRCKTSKDNGMQNIQLQVFKATKPLIIRQRKLNPMRRSAIVIR